MRPRALVESTQVRYVLVAGSSAAWFLTVYTVGVATGLHYMLALFVAHVAAIAVAFPLYRRFVFGAGGTVLGDLARFASVWAGGALAGAVLLPFLVEVFGLHPVLGQVTSIGLIAVATFVAHARLTFRAR